MSTAQNLEAITFSECKPFLPNFTAAKCIKVYDGELFHVGVYLQDYGATRFTCRLVGIDTPELRAKSKGEKTLAKIAREEFKSIALNKLIHVSINGLDKYGRLYMRVSCGEIKDISQHLIDNGLAVPFDGGRKTKVAWDTMLKSWMLRRQGTHEDPEFSETDEE